MMIVGAFGTGLPIGYADDFIIGFEHDRPTASQHSSTPVTTAIIRRSEMIMNGQSNTPDTRLPEVHPQAAQ